MAKKPVQSNSTTKLWVKIVCGIMGFLMVFGVLTMLLSTIRSVATENDHLDPRADQQITVGLYCNENAVQSYTLQSDQGFQVKGTSSDLSVKLSHSEIIATLDGNLYRVGNQLSTQQVGVATVGGYHIEISNFTFSDLGIDSDHDNPVFIRPGNTGIASDGYKPSNVQDYIDILSTNSTFKALNLPAFVYYDSQDKCYIRVGEFFTENEATEVLNQLRKTITLTARIVSPDENNLTILANDYTILCELAGRNQSYQLSSTNDHFMQDDSGRTFSGNILLSRQSDQTNNGLNVVNQVSLESYIAALLPSEVADTWNSEVLKTMAVVLRTEITRKLESHASEGYDICCESHCHEYIGGAPATDTILKAVTDTAGQILTHEDQAIYTPYAMSIGSSTISAKDAFGKEIPYLPSVYTPWENSNVWTAEFAPYELYQLLSSNGYSEIQGNIVAVEIKTRANNSDYVTEISFTDLFDHTITVQGSEAIRILFAGKLPSACFDVGMAGETITRTKRVLTGDTLDYTESEETIELNGTYGSFVFIGRGSGCGVGLSINGALALAEKGMTYDEILDCYFCGSVLTGKLN